MSLASSLTSGIPSLTGDEPDTTEDTVLRIKNIKKSLSDNVDEINLVELAEEILNAAQNFKIHSFEEINWQDPFPSKKSLAKPSLLEKIKNGD